MQILYVVRFDVTAATGLGEEHASGITLDLLAKWLNDDEGLFPSRLAFEGQGEVSLKSRHQDVSTSLVSWSQVGDQEVRATRVERRDIAPDQSEFITRVTVGVSDDGVSVRISMAQEAIQASLSPFEPAIPRQPGFVRLLVADERLVVRADGPVADGKYLQIRSPEEVRALAGAINSRHRLPLLLLHTRTLASHRASIFLSSRLIGLVRVVTLDYRAARQLENLHGWLRIPYAGGLLVWADKNAQPLEVAQAMIEAQDGAEELRRHLMTIIAPLSVLVRGDDDVYRMARMRERAGESRLAAEEVARAQESGDLEDQVAALRRQLERSTSDAEEAIKLWEAAHSLAETRANDITRLMAQVQQLSYAAKYVGTSDGSGRPTSLDDAPPLVAGDSESLASLCKHLEEATKGHLAFTTNELTTWKRASKYPTPELMRTALIALGKVAEALYDGEEKTMGHVDTWIRENYDLKTSLQDDGMPKKFRYSTFDDKKYDFTPHVKVNDGVPPHECGRIYFCFDKENERIIVDKVGLHW